MHFCGRIAYNSYRRALASSRSIQTSLAILTTQMRCGLLDVFVRSVRYEGYVEDVHEKSCHNRLTDVQSVAQGFSTIGQGSRQSLLGFRRSGWVFDWTYQPRPILQDTGRVHTKCGNAEGLRNSILNVVR